MPLSTCTKCPTLIPLGQSRCFKHRLITKPKASRQARGYGQAHIHLRNEWSPYVESGTIKCRRCQGIIRKGEAWDLGHHDTDRTKYTGPEHSACNRGRKKAPPPILPG